MPEGNKIVIREPEAGCSLHVTMRPEQVYLLGFAPETSTFEQAGQDVRVLFESGADIVLHDFFTAAGQRDFTLELRDGTQISGRDMAEVLAMSLKDFHTDGEQLAVVGMADSGAAFGSGTDGADKSGKQTLKLDDVLDVSRPVLFADASGSPRPEEGSALFRDPAADAGAGCAEGNTATPAGQSMPGESPDALLLAFWRIDM